MKLKNNEKTHIKKLSPLVGEVSTVRLTKGASVSRYVIQGQQRLRKRILFLLW